MEGSGFRVSGFRIALLAYRDFQGVRFSAFSSAPRLSWLVRGRPERG